jgi:tRNA (guanine37-N1)-methyltransferase
VDQRVLDARGFEEVSVGDAVLAGGEAAAMVVIEACVRLISRSAGPFQTALQFEESFEDGLLEHPQYTRPRTFEGLEIPEVLLSGDHKKVAQWREEHACERRLGSGAQTSGTAHQDKTTCKRRARQITAKGRKGARGVMTC